MNIKPNWIAVDWGTSNLRVSAMDADGTLIAERQSDDGMAGLTKDAFEPALLALLEPWIEEGRCTPVFACGMVGAKQGWCEVPYSTLPCDPQSLHPIRIKTIDQRIDVRIVPGLKSIDPADVMRGEETQICGLLVEQPNFKGWVCTPGTHTKWCRVEGGKITQFRSFMTGELFALCAGQSVLRHSVGEGWDEATYEEALQLAQDGGITSRLFSVRAESLLSNSPLNHGRSRLSGLLVGAELMEMLPQTAQDPIVIIGSKGHSERYLRALGYFGKGARIFDGDKAAQLGLLRISQQLEISPRPRPERMFEKVNDSA